MRRLRYERGAVSITTAIVLVLIIGFAALAIDAGALWWDRKELQNGADAAALALAQSCAETGGAPGCENDRLMAENYAKGNKSDSDAAIPAGTAGIKRVDNSVTVTVTSEREFWFAPILRRDASSVGASATAAWGSPGTATVLPLTVSKCYFLHDDGTIMVPGETEKFPLNGGSGEIPPEKVHCHEGSPHYVPGGFGWLKPDTPKKRCEITITAGHPTGLSSPGNKYDKDCEGVLDDLEVGSIVFVPVFHKTNGKKGASAEFWIDGFAKLEITTACFHSSGPTVGSGVSCTGNSSFIEGIFHEMMDLDAVLGSGTDYGMTTVQLTD